MLGHPAILGADEAAGCRCAGTIVAVCIRCIFRAIPRPQCMIIVTCDTYEPMVHPCQRHKRMALSPASDLGQEESLPHPLAVGRTEHRRPYELVETALMLENPI
jgi:hypothetical protein